MIIIWGTRSYFRTNKTSQHGFCPHCGKFVKFRSWNGMNFFHLYYIPLIPLDSRKRNHKCCTKCNLLRMMSIEEFESTLRFLKEHSASAILALREGEEKFEIQSGNEVDGVGFLEGAIDWFYAANDHEFIQGILRQLDQPECHYASMMLRANFETMANRLDAAIDFYGHAQTLSPESYVPSLRRAQLLVEKRKIDEAIADYRTAARLGKGQEYELAIQLQMVELLMKRKLFPEAALAYDRIIELKPSLMEDRAFAKQVTKARQKAEAT